MFDRAQNLLNSVQMTDIAGAGVPEPVSISLFGLGLAVLAVARRKRAAI